VNKKIAKKLSQRKRIIRKRLDKRSLPEEPRPMLNPGKIHYEMAERTRGITCGGIGAVQALVKKLGLDKTIDSRLRIFKLRNPYFESDHVLNIAYNILMRYCCRFRAGGRINMSVRNRRFFGWSSKRSGSIL